MVCLGLDYVHLYNGKPFRIAFSAVKALKSLKSAQKTWSDYCHGRATEGARLLQGQLLQ